MSTSTALRPSVRAAFSALIDYAGLFPPAKLGMAEALAEYRAARKGPFAWMLGRFIVPASRLSELLALAGGGDGERLPLSVIIDADAEPRRWFGSAQRLLAEVSRVHGTQAEVAVEALEAAIPPPLTLRETHDSTIGQLAGLVSHAHLRDLPLFVELPRGDRWLELLPGGLVAAARARAGVKVRCGGISADAFPPVDELAAFIDAAAAEQVPFKATAGLHHPVRHHNAASGFTMHGFLNLLAAAALAHRVDRAAIESILAEEDPRAFGFDDLTMAWRDDRVSVADLAAAREDAFVAYGSCSFSEPVDDLIALSILGASA
jgi:hypothetical protein